MRIVYIFLLVAGPFCVWGQMPQGRMDLPPMASAIPKWEPGKLTIVPGPTVLFKDTALGPRREIGSLLEKYGSGGALLLPGSKPLVRLMAPDGMPCVTPNMRKVERMPVDRRGNADRMRRDLRIF